MDISLLEEFLVVAKHRNVTEAARALYMSQSTLSGHMKALEHELGAALLHREKPLRLTGAGAALVKHASIITAQYEIMREAVESASQSEQELCVSLNETHTASHHAWQALVDEMAARHPHLSVRGVPSRSSTAREALERDGTDCVLVGIAPFRSDLEAGLKCAFLDSWADDGLYVWAHTSSPLASMKSVKWSDLRDLRHPSNTYLFPLWAESIRNCLESHGVSARFYENQIDGRSFLFSLGEDEVQIFDETYRSIAGIARIPDRVFVPIDEADARDRACLVYHPEKISPALRRLLDFIEERRGAADGR